VNVGVPGAPTTPTVNPNSPYISSGLINTGKAPVLASCFSEVFTVYSAKKFPGVVESTPLSKCFATQGIKIPIRKEAKNGKDRDEYEED
jgi:Velvet factor